MPLLCETPKTVKTLDLLLYFERLMKKLRLKETY
jgi:hypothetical protein